MSKVDIEVISAVLDGVTSVTRRAEIYEADATTLWIPSADTPRLIDGSVSIDYSRDERRSLDVTFDNADRVLNHNPDGFWYDKIIKVFRGINYTNKKTQPSIIILEDSGSTGQKLYPFLKALGYTDVVVRAVTALEDLYGYDIVAVNSANGATTNGTLISQAFDAGFNILSVGNLNTSTQIPKIITTSISKSTTVAWEINQTTTDNPLKTGWQNSVLTGNTTTGQHVTVLATNVRSVAGYTWSGNAGYTAAILENSTGARWLHLQLVLTPQTNVNLKRLMANGINWLYSYAQLREWEIQLGEFMIDRIAHDHFPHVMKVTGRDYTKKLMRTKFRDSLTFVAGTPIDVLVRALCANAGLTKFMLDSEDAALGVDMTFARGDDRWKAIKDCCVATGTEVFFNSTGHIVTRPFKDPVTSPATMKLSMSEEDANLTALSIESNDTSMYNVVVVTSENSDGLSSGTFFQGVAINDQPTSPTRVSRLGEITYPYTTSVAASDEDCAIIAQNLLSVMALEEFSLNFGALVYPWADAGDIVTFENPEDEIQVPDRYLLTSVTIPLSLAPMDGVAKRVSIVGPVVEGGGA